MKIEGTREIPAPRDRVWAAFLDPAVLSKAIPGCEALEEVGPGEYKAVMKIGVGAIKGTFEGKVRLFDDHGHVAVPSGQDGVESHAGDQQRGGVSDLCSAHHAAASRGSEIWGE